MKYNTMTPSALAGLIGSRIKQYRLNANKTQDEIAAVTGLSRPTINNVENGKSKLETVMAVMLALDLTEHLDLFMPEPGISPIQLAKLKGKKRVRASKSTPIEPATDEDEDELGW